MDDLAAATKNVLIAGKRRTISGVSADDPYFQMVSDDFENDFVQFCAAFIRPDYVCLDIGANIGVKSLALCQFVPQGRVVAIEAGLRVSSLLADNVRGEPNVSVIHAAVTDHDGYVPFAEDSAYGYINPAGSDVPCRRLASLVAERKLSRLDFIKIDVEGHEYAILKDALDLINRHRALVYLEFNSFCQLMYAGVNPRDFAEWITCSFGYVYILSPGSRQLERIPAGLDGAFQIMAANMTRDSAVSDIIATNAPERLLTRSLPLQSAPRADSPERAALIQAHAELDAARREIATLKASASWRLSAPVRKVGDVLRRVRRTV